MNISGYIKCQIAILPVKDVQESVAYYRDVLGFDTTWIWEDGGYAGVKCGDIEFHLDKQEDFDVYRAHSYLFVENADDVYTLFKSRGVEVVQDIETKPWGVREFTFRDINGHMFRVGHSTI